MSEEIRFFLPGPTYVLKDIRQAMTRPSIAHRGAEFKTLYASLCERLPTVFKTSGPVMAMTSSGSLAWDVVICSTIEKNVLCLTNGAFSERFHAVCNAWGKNVDEVSAPWGRPIDPDQVRTALRRKSYEAVTLAHSETSTGVLNPLKEIAAVIREESDALICVDAISSLAGAEVQTEAWGIDYLFTASQKALALPPGLCLITASPRALAKAQKIAHRGYYTDLLRYLAKHEAQGTISTPALPQLWALDKQLDVILEEGMENRWQRHSALRARTERWAASRGFTYASSPDGASPTVSCLRPPEGVDAPTLVKALAAEDFTVGPGYGQFKPTTLRIGHMGQVQLSDLEALFDAIDDLVAA